MASIQFSGLASGLDTDSIVKSMLSKYQTKIDTANNDKTKLEWKKEQWKTVNASINSFKSKYIDKLRYEATFESYTATISNSAVSVNMTGNMPVGTHKIEVTKLATEISMANDITADISSKSKSFKELGLLGEGDSTKLIINREVDQNGDVIQGKEGIEIEVTEKDTLQTLQEKIKGADSSLNVNFDVKNKKLFISSKETGTNSKVNIDASGDTTGLFQKIGLSGHINQMGTGAEYKYNGEVFKSDTNKVEINGLSLTLKEENQPVTVEVKFDPDQVVAFMGEFVDAYNELIKQLNGLYSATKVSTTPLTDEQKEGMTEKQIDEYEKTIKDSLLRRDSSLQKVISSLRGSMQNVVEGNKYKVLSQIGITTGSYTENGKLTLNTDKLKKALEENPQAVKELFTSRGITEETVVDGKVTQAINVKTMGLGTRLNNTFLELERRVEDVKSYQSYYHDVVNQDKITDMKDRISELEDKYKKMETMYYKKFTAMEKALSTLNSQSASFTSMLGN